MSAGCQSSSSQSSHSDEPSPVETLGREEPAIDLKPQLEAPLPQVLEHLGQLVRYRSATVQLEDHGALWIVAHSGFSLPESTSLRHPVAEDELYETIAQTGKPLVVRDVQQDPRRPVRPDLDHVRAWIGAPLIVGDQVAGLITVGNDQPDAYSAHDAEIVAAFASQAAAIIEKVRLSQRLSRSERLYQTLQEVVALVNSTLDPDLVLNAILKQVERIVPYDSASIHLLRANQLSYAAGQGFPVDSHPDTELSAGENAIFQEIRQTKQTMVIEDVRQHPDWHTKPGLEYIRSWIGAPLVVKERVIGYLTLDHSQVGAYTEEDGQIADTFARQVAVAIENARLYTETRRRAEEQAALNTVATAASRSLNLKTMLNHVLNAVRELFDADVAEARLLAESGEELHVTVRRDRAALGEGQAQPLPDQSYATPTLRENCPLVDTKASLTEGEAKAIEKTVAAVPLRSKEQLLGSLSIISDTRRQLTPQELSLMEAIGYQLSLAIENARLYEQLKESEARKTSLLHELEKSLQELQRTQAKLIQSEKLAAIGQLVSGVAHELNNPLTSIIGYAQLLQSADLGAGASADLDRIIEQARRSARIVRNLLTFGRQQKPERQLVDVNRLIEDTLELISYQLTMYHVTVDRHLSEDVPLLLADPHQLQQVWLNLIQNACQAMSDSHGGGVLHIRSFVTDEGKIRVEFSDNGPGIALDVIEKIFDPFFTTKPVGRGTGLGLSICYGIVQEHQGQIGAENNAEGGATFVVELPIQEADEYAVKADESLPVATPVGARILVVDDEPAILELVNRLLTQRGYDVETAEDGDRAIERIVQDDFDVIVLDMVMPQKGGITTYQEIVEFRPELGQRVVFATGDLVTEDTRAFFEETRSRYIAKPFDLDELTRVIQEAVERRG